MINWWLPSVWVPCSKKTLVLTAIIMVAIVVPVLRVSQPKLWNGIYQYPFLRVFSRLKSLQQSILIRAESVRRAWRISMMTWPRGRCLNTSLSESKDRVKALSCSWGTCCVGILDRICVVGRPGPCIFTDGDDSGGCKISEGGASPGWVTSVIDSIAIEALASWSVAFLRDTLSFWPSPFLGLSQCNLWALDPAAENTTDIDIIGVIEAIDINWAQVPGVLTTGAVEAGVEANLAMDWLADSIGCRVLRRSACWGLCPVLSCLTWKLYADLTGAYNVAFPQTKKTMGMPVSRWIFSPASAHLQKQPHLSPTSIRLLEKMGGNCLNQGGKKRWKVKGVSPLSHREWEESLLWNKFEGK